MGTQLSQGAIESGIFGQVMGSDELRKRGFARTGECQRRLDLCHFGSCEGFHGFMTTCCVLSHLIACCCTSGIS